MTYGEILDYIVAYRKKELRRQKEQAKNLYTVASLIKTGIMSAISEEVKYPSIKELYPGIFDEEVKIAEESVAERDMEIWKQKMINFAENHNRMRKRGEDD